MKTQLRTGAAYYPEHWPEATWPLQAQRMREIGLTTLRVGEFAWALMEPEEGRFEFDWLDRSIAIMAAEGLEVIIGTPTAAPPAWLTRRYSDVRLVDERGAHLPHGGRRHVCVTSASYRQLTDGIVRAIGEHYADNEAVIAFQTDNEFGCHVAACYCPECQAAFREYLRRQFGTIERLRQEWDADFWSIRPESFDDLPPEDWHLWLDMQHPGLKLEYKRFTSGQWCSYHRLQRDILTEVASGKPVFHNMMGLDSGYDHFQMARDSDFVGVDIYPPGTGPDPKTGNPIYNPVRLSLAHNVTRSHKRDVPYHVVESPLAAVNWGRVNSLPRPGQAEMWAHMAFSHGADSYLTFRWQAIRSGSEKHHCAVLMHDLRMDGPNVPIAKRIAETASLLSEHLAGTVVRNRVAFAHSYENLWQSVHGKSERTRDYWGLWLPWCEALFSLNVGYDVVDLNTEDRLADYDLVILSQQQNVSAEMADRLRAYVAGGGTLVATFMTGWANEFGRMWDVPQPAPLTDLFGIVVQTHDPLEETRTNSVQIDGGAAHEATHWCDIIIERGAEVVGTFAEDFYAGSPAITASAAGKGRAWYVGTLPGEELALQLVSRLCTECDIPTHDLPLRVQYLTRVGDDGRQVDYYLNHSGEAVTLTPVRPGTNLATGQPTGDRLALEGYGAVVLAAT
jgi:beta-galactosidase